MRLIGCEWKSRKVWSDTVLIGRGLNLRFHKHDRMAKSLRTFFCIVLREQTLRFSGDSCEDTPVPMPNTVVKLTNAESTWLEAAWEDRKLLINKEALAEMQVLFL